MLNISMTMIQFYAEGYMPFMQQSYKDFSLLIYNKPATRMIYSNYLFTSTQKERGLPTFPPSHTNTHTLAYSIAEFDRGTNLKQMTQFTKKTGKSAGKKPGCFSENLQACFHDNS